MALRVTRSGLFARASSVIPRQLARACGRGRCRRAVLRRPGSGRVLWDADGDRYIDWVMSWGPLVFGHADAEIVEAVQEAAADVTTFGVPTEREVALAEEPVDAVPSIEKVRLVSSGTEAAMSALRLARGVTVIGSSSSPAATTATPTRSSPPPAWSRHAGDPLLGVPPSSGRDTLVCAYNDAEAVTRRSSATVESLRRSSSSRSRETWGSSPPSRARGAARSCRRVRGTARLRRGHHGVSSRPGRRAGALRRQARPHRPRQDRGRGPPLAAFRGERRRHGRAGAGRARLPGRHAVRKSARNRGCARRPPPPAVPGMSTRGSTRPAARLEAGLREAAGDSPVCVQRGAMATLFFQEGRVPSFDAAAASDTERYGAWFRHLLARRQYVAPSQFEALFVSTAHGEPGRCARRGSA